MPGNTLILGTLLIIQEIALLAEFIGVDWKHNPVL
jgi:hypothetical protein